MAREATLSLAQTKHTFSGLSESSILFRPKNATFLNIGAARNHTTLPTGVETGGHFLVDSTKTRSGSRNDRTKFELI